MAWRIQERLIWDYFFGANTFEIPGFWHGGHGVLQRLKCWTYRSWGLNIEGEMAFMRWPYACDGLLLLLIWNKRQLKYKAYKFDVSCTSYLISIASEAFDTHIN
jgi:hypothetical protein